MVVTVTLDGYDVVRFSDANTLVNLDFIHQLIGVDGRSGGEVVLGCCGLVVHLLEAGEVLDHVLVVADQRSDAFVVLGCA